MEKMETLANEAQAAFHFRLSKTQTKLLTLFLRRAYTEGRLDGCEYAESLFKSRSVDLSKVEEYLAKPIPGRGSAT